MQCRTTTFLYTNYRAADDYRDRYPKVFGHVPFVSPFVRWRWSELLFPPSDCKLKHDRRVGKQCTHEQHDEGMHRIKVYGDWFLNTVMQIGKKNTYVIIQSEDVRPNYRDDPPPYAFRFYVSRFSRTSLDSYVGNTTFSPLGINGGSLLY